MMHVLTDPKSRFEAKREAAENLASFNEDRRFRTTIHPTIIGGDLPKKPNLVVAKFSKPTVAEAIVAAMDADLKAFDAKPSKDDADRRAYQRRGIEGTYLQALVELGDERIAPEAAKRTAASKTLRERRQWAHAAHLLGDPKPFRAFAEDFQAGKIVVPAGEEDELERILRSLIGLGTPESERALAALTDAKHPQHKAVAEQVLSHSPRGTFDHGVWFAHPFCLNLLRQALDDKTPTDAKYVIEENSLRRKEKDGWSGSNIPQYLSDPTLRREEAPERACDTAAEKLRDLVVGLPLCHPLFKDADKRLEALKVAFDRFAGKYRRPTGFEQHFLNLSPFSTIFVPDIKPLGRAATADDVKAGLAVFHIAGKGKPADLKLPAVAGLKRDEKNERAGKVVIVQAEVGTDGAVTYGILSKDGIRSVPASELVEIKTLDQLRKEQEEAEKEREKAKDKHPEKKD